MLTPALKGDGLWELLTPFVKEDRFWVFVFSSDIGQIFWFKATKVPLDNRTGKTSFYDKTQAFYDSAKIDLS